MSAFSFRHRLQSFTHAIRGAGTLLTTQHNVWVHCGASWLVVIAGFAVGISRLEWVSLTVAIALVWLTEALNTAIEFLADEISMEHRERIGKAKDVAAFGVLVAAIAAAAIGCLIFLPHLSNFAR